MAGTTAIALGVACAPRIYGETQRTANARLIAAAPELSQALMAIWHATVDEDGISRTVRDANEIDKAYTLASAVLLKLGILTPGIE